MKFKLSLSSRDLGRLAGVWIGTLFSPAWIILKTAFLPYINLETPLAQGVGLSVIQNFHAQLNALAPDILLGRIMPVLLVGILISMGYLYVCGWLGQIMMRYAVRGFQWVSGATQDGEQVSGRT